jgi:hypothetical protein
MMKVVWCWAQRLLSVYMIKWKILTQKVTSEVGAKGWDKALEGKEEKKFLTPLRDLDVLRKIKIPRYIMHMEGQFKESTLLVFRDSS